MLRSVYLTFGVALALAACATSRTSAPQAIPGGETAGSLVIAPGVPVLWTSPMPPRFEPIAFRGPLWFRQGEDIVAAGTIRGRAIVLDFDRQGREEPRIIAADNSPEATIEDLAPSPDRWSLALAVSRSGGSRLDIIRYDFATDRSRDQRRIIASLDVKSESVSLGWPAADTIAVAMWNPLPAVSGESRGSRASGPATTNQARLYLIPASGSGAQEQLHLDCALSPLVWSPDGAYAVGQGEGPSAPIVIDRQKQSCTTMNVAGPIRVLEWAPGSKALIYAGLIAGSAVPGVFRFDIASGRTVPLAFSSSAAVFVSDVSILALGNRDLTAQRVLAGPQARTTAEVAMIDPAQGSIRVQTLGVETSPEMLASSAMAYSARSATAAIELFAPGGGAALRHIIGYSTDTGRETLLAGGPAPGLALMSWSPNGRTLALLHGDSSATQLTLLLPGAAAQIESPPSLQSPSPFTAVAIPP